MVRICVSAKCKKPCEIDKFGYCNLCFLYRRNRCYETKTCLKCKGSNEFQYFSCKNIGLGENQYHPFKIRYLCRTCIHTPHTYMTSSSNKAMKEEYVDFNTIREDLDDVETKLTDCFVIVDNYINYIETI